MFSDLIFRLRAVFQRRKVETELDDELREHYEHEVAKYMRAGVAREEAQHRAHLALGGIEQTKEECRQVRGTHFLETTLQDLRYALRTLRKSPGFTAAAILTLGLGIGANTAIFQLLDAVRLRTLPVHNPQELAEVRIVGGNTGMGLNQQYGELTQPLWHDIREKQHAFSGAFAWSVNQRYIGQGSEMRHFNALFVSGDFFRVLGVDPFRGRLSMPEDEGPCPMNHAVASYAYWQSELGGRAVSSGIKLIANNYPVEIVGVTPSDTE